MRQVCPVESAWVGDTTAKLQDVDVQRLSGSATSAVLAAATGRPPHSSLPAAALSEPGQSRLHHTAVVDAAKARFQARKAAKGR